MIKRHCKQLERRWRASQEELDKDVIKFPKRSYLQQIWETKRKALAKSINNNSNSRKDIFAITKDFTTPEATSSNITPTQELCRELSDFFCSKITSIYSNFDSQLHPISLAISLPVSDKGNIMTI